MYLVQPIRNCTNCTATRLWPHTLASTTEISSKKNANLNKFSEPKRESGNKRCNILCVGIELEGVLGLFMLITTLVESAWKSNKKENKNRISM